MRLLEFQAKRILAKSGIPVPPSRLLRLPSEVAGLSFPAVLKAQVPIGGRGKAGGIRVVHHAVEACVQVEELLTTQIRGYPVRAILAEPKVEVRREFYLALLVDARTNQPMVMASPAGGMEIEQIARQTPERIIYNPIDPWIGLPSYVIRSLGKTLAIRDGASLSAILEAMVGLLASHDATLVEINPLAETPDGLVALDAKIVLDDKAAYRHPGLFAWLREEQNELGRTDKTRAELLAEERRISYILLDGEIGLITDGAGTGMLTLDLIQEAGGRAANFCEMGGLANAEIMAQSMEVVLANPRVKALLISLIGGLTRMDEMAEGIACYLERHPAAVPLIVRMCGTQEEVGKATLRRVGIEPFDDLDEAVQHVVRVVEGSSPCPF
ncbi:MAG: succinate--CoA ligase subunit beta [Anaerolineae bacterium]